MSNCNPFNSIIFPETPNQEVSITVNQPGTVDIGLLGRESGLISMDFSGGGGSCKVLYDTTAHWDAKPDLIAKEGYIYIYSDWGESPDGKKIAGFKVGDGITPLIDILFTDQMYDDHIKNAIVHITQEEREYWNDKVTCSYISELEKIIFSK